MLPILFHPEAAIEASVAADWYELQQPGLGQRFENDLQTTARHVQVNPLIYAAEKHDERTWVSCVSHHKRRPGYWRKCNPD